MTALLFVPNALADEKITAEMKLTYIREISEHGRHATAAHKSGMRAAQARRLLERDPDFKMAADEALEVYRDKVVGHHQKLVFEGTTKKVYDRNGALISEEIDYPTNLLMAELKRVDSSYRDKQTVDVKVSGGVMIAPAQLQTIEDWEKKFSGYQPPLPEHTIRSSEDVEEATIVSQ